MSDDNELLEHLRARLGDTLVIERELGRGGMSRVFVATDPSLGRKLVVKVLSPELSAGVNVDRFRREIAITARLQHPHVVPIFSTSEIDGLPFYTMPLVEGESLHDRLRREGPLPMGDAVSILRDVARALEYAHSRGVVHRDVKPGNVLLSSGTATVSDFGIAKALVSARGSTTDGTITGSGVSVGTPAYMAPEQAAAEENVDHRADIYAFGCTAYETLTGAPPFANRSTQAMIAAHIVEAPEPVTTRRPEIPPPLAELVMRCLSKDPRDRPQQAGELVRALGGVPLTAESAATTLADPTPSIAVLPFANMSQDPENEYLSDGITEEILNTLARVRKLRVAARTSSFAFKGKNADIQEIGRKLRVSTVLEGSVRRSANRLRVAAQLVNVADGYPLWSDRFDRQMADIFDLQDEIAGSIVDALQGALFRTLGAPTEPATRRATPDVEAYELYLRGRHFLSQRLEGMWKSMEYYRKALDRDPGFALAHSGVAEAQFLLTLYAAVPPREGVPKARAAAHAALAIDPTIADPYTVLANAALWFDWDFPETRRLLDRAIELKPSDPLAQSCYGYYHAARGEFDEAIVRVRAALELDPLSMWAQSNLAVTLYLGRRFEDAVAQCQAMIELSPSYSEAWRWLALSLLHLGRTREAFEAIQQAVARSQRSFWALANLGGMLARGGRTDQAREILAELEARSMREYIPTFAMATLHYGLGDLDATFQLLEQSLEARDFWLVMLDADPGFDFLRRDPRYAPFIARVRRAAG